MPSFLRATTKDNGIYDLVREHQLFTTVQKCIMGDTDCINRTQRSSLNIWSPHKWGTCCSSALWRVQGEVWTQGLFGEALDFIIRSSTSVTVQSSTTSKIEGWASTLAHWKPMSFGWVAAESWRPLQRKQTQSSGQAHTLPGPDTCVHSPNISGHLTLDRRAWVLFGKRS